MFTITHHLRVALLSSHYNGNNEGIQTTIWYCCMYHLVENVNVYLCWASFITKRIHGSTSIAAAVQIVYSLLSAEL